MLANPPSPKIVKITTYMANIESALFASADAKISKGLSFARDEMFSHIGASGFARYEVGIAVTKYHAFYKEVGHKAWRDQIGPAVISALGYKSLKSLYNLMDDAELASKLSTTRRGALVSLGIDPASRKNAELVKTLFTAPSGESPSDAEAAATTAQAKILADQKHRSKERRKLASDPKEFTRQIANRLIGSIVDFTNHVQGQDPIVVFNEIFELVRARLTNEEARSQPSSITVAEDVTSKSGIKQSAAIAHGAKPALVSTRAPTVKSFGASGLAHPWGDECLHSLKFVSGEHKGKSDLLFDRERLYKVREDMSPKRFLVNDSPDLFNLESDDVIREHLKVFADASWHVFQLLTNNLHRVRYFQLAMKKDRRTWPFNLWVGTNIECREDFGRIADLANLDLETSWISLADYHSDGSHPLVHSALAQMQRSSLPRWIVGRADVDDQNRSFSLRDALYLRDDIRVEANCPVFFAQPGTRAAFVNGDIIARPVTHDPRIADFLKVRDFPTDGFQLQRRPSENTTPKPFEGEPSELIGYRGNSLGV